MVGIDRLDAAEERINGACREINQNASERDKMIENIGDC